MDQDPRSHSRERIKSTLSTHGWPRGVIAFWMQRKCSLHRMNCMHWRKTMDFSQTHKTKILSFLLTLETSNEITVVDNKWFFSLSGSLLRDPKTLRDASLVCSHIYLYLSWSLVTNHPLEGCTQNRKKCSRFEESGNRGEVDRSRRRDGYRFTRPRSISLRNATTSWEKKIFPWARFLAFPVRKEIHTFFWIIYMDCKYHL